MKLKRGDIVLIIFLSVFALVLSWYISFVSTGSSGDYVSVQVNGQEIKQIQFSDEMIGKTFEIKTEFGRNVLEIGDKTVRVIEADCPDKLDVKQGEISQPGQVIVCLPNRLLVEYKAKNLSNDEIIDNFNY